MAYKSTLVKKQMSTPTMIKATRAAKPVQSVKSSSTSTSKFSKRSFELPVSNRLTPSSNSFFSSRMEPRDLEISSTFESPQWTEKTLSEKNQWVTSFLNKTKADISFVLKHVTGLIMDGDSTMKDETCELLSMPGINPRVSATDNCLRAMRSKLLEEKCVKFTSELENRDKMIKDLSEQLNKDKLSQETQTCGITIDELKKSLLETSNENVFLRVELNSANSKLDNLNKTFEEIKGQNSKLIVRLSDLQIEKNKFKQEFLDAQKQRDEYYESWMEVKEKCRKTSEKFQNLKSETDANSKLIRQDEVHRSMIESDLIDKTKLLEMELGKKGKEMARLRSTIWQLENSIERYREVDQEQSKTIESLKENVNDMETRAQCWINRNVRDTFETKINHLEHLVEQLKTDKKLLHDECKKAAVENSEQATKSDKYITRLQSHMDGQQKLINLMRKVKFNPSKFDQSSTLNSIFLKFEDEQKMRQDLERLIQENYILQKRNVEYKKVVDSHPFKQLFVSY